MSRQPKIEEVSDAEFDDDFDMPLPNRPMPSSSAGSGSAAGSSGMGSGPGASFMKPPPGVQIARDLTPYKSWTCVYPIYIDAKRPYGVGKRRIAREKSCWWPHSQLISNAAQMLQLRVLHEPEKCHPRDWENPGRVKILLKEEGRPYNRNITTKKQLLEAIGTMIQKLDTSQTPLPEQITASSPEAPSAAEPKSKQSGKGSSKSTSGTKALATSQKPARPARTRTPKPPSPIPALRDRYMVHSPTIPTGTLVDTVKASIKAQEKAAAESAAASTPGLPGAPGSPGGAGAGAGAGAGKGKRKVIRVRG